MTVVRWEEPPENPHRKGKYDAIANEMREHPGQWAVALEAASYGAANAIAVRARKGLSGFAPAGAFEARVTGAEQNAVLYMRFVGSPESAA